jgi:hypothetical protein
MDEECNEPCDAGEMLNPCCALSRNARKRSCTQSYPLQCQSFDDSHRRPAKKNILKMLVLIDLMTMKSTVFWGEGVCSSRSLLTFFHVSKLLAQYIPQDITLQVINSCYICTIHFTFQQINTLKTVLFCRLSQSFFDSEGQNIIIPFHISYLIACFISFLLNLPFQKLLRMFHLSR